MTAKELKQTALTVINKYKPPVYQYTKLEMEMFCEQLCREQRENCGEKYLKADEINRPEMYSMIKNAPMPEI